MAKTSSLDDLDVPGWFANAAEDLKAVRSRWAKGLPAIALHGGGELPADASPWILSAIAFTETESAKHDLVDFMKRQANASALDSWMATVVRVWIDAGAPARDAWVLTGAGFLGGEATVRSLHDAVRKWSKEKDRTLAVCGVDALGRIGSKAALQEVATLSAGIRDHSVADEAQHLIGRVARAQGATREAIEDGHVSDCGLDRKGERILSYGPRSFRVVLGKDLALNLFGEDGRSRASLPPIATTDDPSQAESSRASWVEMKTAIKRVLKSQVKRFEQSMITGRSWSWAEFHQHVLRHNLVSRIAQLLVWQTGGDDSQNLRVTEDLSFATVGDDAVALNESSKIRVAHPLRISPDELVTWSELFSDYRMVQPFQQLTRKVHHCDPLLTTRTFLAAPEHAPIKPGVLYGILDNDGWRLGRSVNGHFVCSWKSFEADGVTAVISYSGLIAGAIGGSPEQVIKDCCFHSGVMTPEQKDPPGKAMSLGLVPAVPFSETMRRLLRLTSEAS